MKINEIIKRINNEFPDNIQESYDNTGTQIIFDEELLKRIYICLDADHHTVNNAKEKNCNLIICHHPLIFKPVKKIVSNESRSEILINLITEKISLFALHTNYDKIMYKALSDFLGYPDSIPLNNTMELPDTITGFGSYIILNQFQYFSEILYNTKNKLGLDFVIYSGDKNKIIRSIAFINGSGGSSIEKVIASHKPDCIITGDVNYHHAKYAIDSGTAFIDAGHFGTEFIFKKLLAQSVANVLYDEKIEIVISDVEKNPFQVYK